MYLEDKILFRGEEAVKVWAPKPVWESRLAHGWILDREMFA